MNKTVPVEIVDFLKSQTCANICCVDENNVPYCFTCFFVYDPDHMCLYFKSSMDTQHAKLLSQNKSCAGTVLEDKLNLAFLKGIQFQGEAINVLSPETHDAPTKYYKKYPAAILVPGKIWTVHLSQIKFTDNTLNFGHKVHWCTDEK